MISRAPLTIFGPFLPLDLQHFPEKSSFEANAEAEFWRVKIDFRQNATKLGGEVARG
jgi:hypothetical protein